MPTASSTWRRATARRGGVVWGWVGGDLISPRPGAAGFGAVHPVWRRVPRFSRRGEAACSRRPGGPTGGDGATSGRFVGQKWGGRVLPVLGLTAYNWTCPTQSIPPAPRGGTPPPGPEGGTPQ